MRDTLFAILDIKSKLAEVWASLGEAPWDRAARELQARVWQPFNAVLEQMGGLEATIIIPPELLPQWPCCRSCTSILWHSYLPGHQFFRDNIFSDPEVNPLLHLRALVRLAEFRKRVNAQQRLIAEAAGGATERETHSFSPSVDHSREPTYHPAQTTHGRTPYHVMLPHVWIQWDKAWERRVDGRV